jgi:ATP-dependent helicase YprA (DUF1998 family)
MPVMSRIQQDPSPKKKIRFIEANINAPWTSDMQARAEIIDEKFKCRPRDWQAHAIQAICDGRDVLIRAGTGTGKSLVFQAMTLVRDDAIVLVVAPLNGLMENQVMPKTPTRLSD